MMRRMARPDEPRTLHAASFRYALLRKGFRVVGSDRMVHLYRNACGFTETDRGQPDTVLGLPTLESSHFDQEKVFILAYIDNNELYCFNPNRQPD